MSLRFAYNTNGMANHRLDDVVALLVENGYDGVALTLDHCHLDPFASDSLVNAARLRRQLDDVGLAVMLETGARFLLDPRAKHEPTFVTPEEGGRVRRAEFLERAVDLAVVLDAETVSFWAGVPGVGVDRTAAWEWLVQGVTRVAAYAAGARVDIAFEPEPGMLVEHAADWERLRDAVADAVPDLPPLRLALDTGHCLVAGNLLPQEAVRRYAADLGTVAVEDMRRGVHEHVAWGEGDMDIPAVLQSLLEVDYKGLVTVELSRDSHRAHSLVPWTIDYLRGAA